MGFCILTVAGVESVLAQQSEIGSVILDACRQWELRQMILTMLEFYVAFISNHHGVADRFRRKAVKDFSHFSFTLEVPLRRIAVAERILVIHSLLHAHAHQRALGEGILLLNVMDIVGRYNLNVQRVGHIQQRIQKLLLVFKTMILKLDVVVLAKDALVLGRQSIGFFLLPCQKQLRNIALDTGTQADDAFVILPQDVQVSSGTIVEPIDSSDAFDFDEVLISLVVLREQDNVPCFAVLFLVDVCGRIQFNTENWLDADGLAGVVELNDAIHIAVVSNGQCRLTQVFRFLNKLLDAAVSVQQAVLGMAVQMYECFFSGAFCHFNYSPLPKIFVWNI